MNHPQLQAQLRRLGWRVRGVGGASGVGWGLVAIVAVAILGAWTDLVLELSPALRMGALAVALLAGLALAIVTARRAWRWGTPDSLARRLDPVAGARGQIIAGVDLLSDERAFTPIEAGLAGIAVDRAAELARCARTEGGAVAASIDLGACGRALAVLVTLVALVLPRLAQAQWLRFADPFGDHPPYSAVVFRVEPGDIRVIYGQGVEIRATVEGARSIVSSWSSSRPTRHPSAWRCFRKEPGTGGPRWPMSRVRAAITYTPTGRASARHHIEVITVPQLSSVALPRYAACLSRRSAYQGPVACRRARRLARCTRRHLGRE